MKSRKLLNIMSLLIFFSSIVVAVVSTISIVKTINYNNALAKEKENIENKIASPSEEYYDVYVIDDYTVYDEKVIIEFSK